MSVHVESWVWKQKVGSPLRKLILVKLAQNSDDDGWSWWRQSKMAVECETSRSTLQTHLRELRGMGMIQAHTGVHAERGRTVNVYRVMVPWADPADVPPERAPMVIGSREPKDGDVSREVTSTDARNQGIDPDAREPGGGCPGAGQGDAREPGTLNRKEEPSVEEESKTLAALCAAVVPLGGRRYRVPSKSKQGVAYVVDLARERCNCQASRRCVHIEAAMLWEEQQETARRRERRDAVWDVMVELFGKPPTRRESQRGALVADLAEALADEKIEWSPERWQDEVRYRYEALVGEWGVARVTEDSFVKNWHLSGKLRSRGSRSVGHNVSRAKTDDPYARGAERAGDGDGGD